mmetsp:Transcript_42092/g.40348  ORF Transcript_42092/g.40348 Transcript_42092/m.40348 type:complete len:93 (-) Transcript_42092:51-329(-)
MFDVTSDYHIVNKWNIQKQRPLYVACKHGHLDVVKLLLNNGSNPHLFSHVSKEESENILEVSARWSHITILEYLLHNIDWSYEELAQVMDNK